MAATTATKSPKYPTSSSHKIHADPHRPDSFRRETLTSEQALWTDLYFSLPFGRCTSETCGCLRYRIHPDGFQPQNLDASQDCHGCKHDSSFHELGGEAERAYGLRNRQALWQYLSLLEKKALFATSVSSSREKVKEVQAPVMEGEDVNVAVPAARQVAKPQNVLEIMESMKATIDESIRQRQAGLEVVPGKISPEYSPIAETKTEAMPEDVSRPQPRNVAGEPQQRAAIGDERLEVERQAQAQPHHEPQLTRDPTPKKARKNRHSAKQHTHDEQAPERNERHLPSSERELSRPSHPAAHVRAQTQPEQDETKTVDQSEQDSRPRTQQHEHEDRHIGGEEQAPREVPQHDQSEPAKAAAVDAELDHRQLKHDSPAEPESASHEVREAAEPEPAPEPEAQPVQQHLEDESDTAHLQPNPEPQSGQFEHSQQAESGHLPQQPDENPEMPIPQPSNLHVPQDSAQTVEPFDMDLANSSHSSSPLASPLGHPGPDPDQVAQEAIPRSDSPSPSLEQMTEVLRRLGVTPESIPKQPERELEREPEPEREPKRKPHKKSRAEPLHKENPEPPTPRSRPVETSKAKRVKEKAREKGKSEALAMGGWNGASTGAGNATGVGTRRVKPTPASEQAQMQTSGWQTPPRQINPPRPGTGVSNPHSHTNSHSHSHPDPDSASASVPALSISTLAPTDTWTHEESVIARGLTAETRAGRARLDSEHRCYHCKHVGHLRRDCPDLDEEDIHPPRNTLLDRALSNRDFSEDGAGSVRSGGTERGIAPENHDARCPVCRLYGHAAEECLGMERAMLSSRAGGSQASSSRKVKAAKAKGEVAGVEHRHDHLEEQPAPPSTSADSAPAPNSAHQPQDPSRGRHSTRSPSRHPSQTAPDLEPAPSPDLKIWADESEQPKITEADGTTRYVPWFEQETAADQSKDADEGWGGAGWAEPNDGTAGGIGNGFDAWKEIDHGPGWINAQGSSWADEMEEQASRLPRGDDRAWGDPSGWEQQGGYAGRGGAGRGRGRGRGRGGFNNNSGDDNAFGGRGGGGGGNHFNQHAPHNDWNDGFSQQAEHFGNGNGSATSGKYKLESNLSDRVAKRGLQGFINPITRAAAGEVDSTMIAVDSATAARSAIVGHEEAEGANHGVVGEDEDEDGRRGGMIREVLMSGKADAGATAGGGAFLGHASLQVNPLANAPKGPKTGSQTLMSVKIGAASTYDSSASGKLKKKIKHSPPGQGSKATHQKSEQRRRKKEREAAAAAEFVALDRRNKPHTNVQHDQIPMKPQRTLSPPRVRLPPQGAYWREVDANTYAGINVTGKPLKRPPSPVASEVSNLIEL